MHGNNCVAEGANQQEGDRNVFHDCFTSTAPLE